DEPLIGAEQLVRDDQRADRIIAGPPAGVADHVRISFPQAERLGGIDARVHAGEDRVLADRIWSRTAGMMKLLELNVRRRDCCSVSGGSGTPRRTDRARLGRGGYCSAPECRYLGPSASRLP